MADQLGISQQAVNSFEKGRRRVPVSLLPVVAQTLQTTLDALVDHDSTPAIAAPKKRGPQKKIQQLQQIEALPVTKQLATPITNATYNKARCNAGVVRYGLRRINYLRPGLLG